ncbi:MAG TPA: TIGR03084 family metal-binding protein [Mycobacteriales bacterium]|nr:TIGR03084 family metal-binding protein [Mycobacteriales bacterium]
MADLDSLRSDLAAELADLDAVVAGLDDEAWLTRTPAQGWDVRDSISHLAGSDAAAVLAVSRPDEFAARLPAVAADPDGFIQHDIDQGRAMPPAGVLEWWRGGRAVMLDAFSGLDPAQRIPWFGPPLGPASFITARLMETWAHGQDVVDALGVRREPTARLRHVADIGVRTRGFSYVLRGRSAPDVPVRVELTAPDGDVWTWGPSEAVDRVTASAYGFCLLVTQRRHRSDVDVQATGAAAAEWLDIAQAFAGLPGPGRLPTPPDL